MSSLSEWTEFSKNTQFQKISIASFAKKGEWADKFMKENHDEIKINQLRNFFSEIQVIQRNLEKWKNDQQRVKDDIALLEMNLAYDYGRNVIREDFYQVMTESLKKVVGAEDFTRFVVFIQSLIAYHKLHSLNK